jgi:hypothetical protein
MGPGWNSRVTNVGMSIGSQQRQRVVFREQPLCATASTASKEREATHGRAPPRWWKLLRPVDMCKVLVLLIGFMVVFHSASCGYFFCTRFPGILDYPRDIYDDLRDIHILRGTGTAQAELECQINYPVERHGVVALQFIGTPTTLGFLLRAN